MSRTVVNGKKLFPLVLGCFRYNYLNLFAPNVCNIEYRKISTMTTKIILDSTNTINKGKIFGDCQKS